MSLTWAKKLFVLALVVGLHPLASRGYSDDLDRFKAENELRAQKLRADVKGALSLAGRLERSDPAGARDLLRRAKTQLEDDVVLPERERTRLLQQVQERLQTMIQAVRAKEAADSEAAQKTLIKEQEKGRREQRDRGRDPNPSSLAKEYQKSVKSRLDAARRLGRESAQGIGTALDDVQLSATKVTEQRITDRFVWATQARMKKMSEKERKVLKTLNSVLSVDFNNARFREVIDYIQEKTDQPIILDDGSMKDAMVEPDDPVSFKGKKLQVRTILRKVLGDRGLTYVVKEGTIQVVTPVRARQMMVTRVYPIADLVAVNPSMGLFGQIMTIQNIQALINTVQGSVDPTLWQDGATITYNPVARALVIRAPAEVHYALGFGIGDK
jgi:hypothetical protein